MLVILGATGDLCKKKVFPSIDALLREILNECVQNEYINQELEKASSSVKSSTSSIQVVDSPITNANPKDIRNRTAYHKATDSQVHVKVLEQSSVLKNSGVNIPRIVGYARTVLSTEEFIRKIDPSINFLKETIEAIEYINGPYEDCLEKLEPLFERHSPEVILLYLAVPPHIYPMVIDQVKKSKRNIVILAEKPQGTSLKSFVSLKKLIDMIPGRFLCVDHYLFKNVLLQLPELIKETLLNELIVPGQVIGVSAYFNECIGVEGRLGYFNSSGTCRDVLQNHLLQAVSIVFAGGTSKTDLLKLISFIPPEKTVYGVYRSYKSQLKKEGVYDIPLETYLHAQTRINGPWKIGLEIECGKKLRTHFVGLILSLSNSAIEIIKGYPVTRNDFENTKKLNKVKPETLKGMIRIEITPKEHVSIDLTHNKQLVKRLMLPVERSENGATPYQTLFKQILLKGNISENFALPEEVYEQWRIVDQILENPAIHKITYSKSTKIGNIPNPRP
ncbi:glucose-6-phosphate 1-dehydrogenase [Nematocida sp. AWRm80]|nr:glucose-6-phosphate 1-dehydrogenase [Nematocida sp. AWRm80]